MCGRELSAAGIFAFVPILSRNYFYLSVLATRYTMQISLVPPLCEPPNYARSQNDQQRLDRCAKTGTPIEIQALRDVERDKQVEKQQR